MQAEQRLELLLANVGRDVERLRELHSDLKAEMVLSARATQSAANAIEFAARLEKVLSEFVGVAIQLESTAAAVIDVSGDGLKLASNYLKADANNRNAEAAKARAAAAELDPEPSDEDAYEADLVEADAARAEDEAADADS